MGLGSHHQWHPGLLLSKLERPSGKSWLLLILQAGPSGDATEIAVPAGLTRLFRHPTLDWGLMSMTQRKVNSREVGADVLPSQIHATTLASFLSLVSLP
jgi:hypothetical protein